MALTLPYPTLGPGVVNSSEINSNFSALGAKFGSIDNADIKAGAGIALSKLAASYEYMLVPLIHVAYGTAGLHTANRVIASAPMYNDGKGAWSTAAYAWHASNAGAKTGAFTVQWGYYNAGGAWTTTSTIVSGEVLDGGTVDTHYQDGATNSQSLAWTQNNMMFRVIVATADTTALDTNAVANVFDWLHVSIQLKRQITT